ncbi:hypothetical protein PHYBOEH_004772 [Phytophthora boehmeriae]|uniref:RxLR effector protein n=1 Tax=Phytophthora boehmeriae TaxID=109152 RepID=A0A8T1WSJ4_9STRA|nr:hypothetical protein PHYBOEH_004772 [Phytophthora boehmeriae]
MRLVYSFLVVAVFLLAGSDAALRATDTNQVALRKANPQAQSQSLTAEDNKRERFLKAIPRVNSLGITKVTTPNVAATTTLVATAANKELSKLGQLFSKAMYRNWYDAERTPLAMRKALKLEGLGSNMRSHPNWPLYINYARYYANQPSMKTIKKWFNAGLNPEQVKVKVGLKGITGPAPITEHPAWNVLQVFTRYYNKHTPNALPA